MSPSPKSRTDLEFKRRGIGVGNIGAAPDVSSRFQWFQPFHDRGPCQTCQPFQSFQLAGTETRRRALLVGTGLTVVDLVGAP